jgi:hypothetical protein
MDSATMKGEEPPTIEEAVDSLGEAAMQTILEWHMSKEVTRQSPPNSRSH